MGRGEGLRHSPLRRIGRPGFRALPGGRLSAQEVIAPPASDRLFDADVDEVYRVAAIDGDAWDIFARVSAVGSWPAPTRR